MSIGTRGDVEPFLAVGGILAEQGHEIIFAFPEQFKPIVPDQFSFYPLSPRFIELIESKEGKMVMGAKATKLAKLRALLYLYRKGNEINQVLVRQQQEITEGEQPDKIIHNAKCSYPTLWSLSSGKESILMSPVPYFMHYVPGHAHIGFPGNYGALINRLTYRLSNFGLVKTIRDAQQCLKEPMNFSRHEIRQALFAKKLVYTIASALFTRPTECPPHVQVLGYHTRNSNTGWQADEPLNIFLEANPKVLLLTFGSMVNADPEGTSRLIYAVLQQLNMPVIVNTASGGLLRLDEFREHPLFHFVEQIPYDYIMKRVYAVIYHGGSGTTHTALRHGLPSLIIPHIMDQFVWNQLLHQRGAGPKGIAVTKLTVHKLRPLVQDLMYNATYQTNAQRIARDMAQVNDRERLRDFIVSPTQPVQERI